jgi:gamma-glutamyltranspeptidase/glutathione hydrolase
MIKQGGNAMDAAIAVQLMLGVTEPYSTGLGGGGFILYHDKKTNTLTAFDGRETAPKAYKEDIFIKDDKVKEFDDVMAGGLTVGTPGMVDMLYKAHQKYGKLEWKTLFEPSIKVANDGYILTDRAVNSLKTLPHYGRLGSDYKRFLDKEGEILAVGSKVTNKPLAETYKLIAEQGPKAFYEGKIAENIVKTVQNSTENKGLLTLEDLKNYKSTTREPICTVYRLRKICSMAAPSSGGITIIQALKMLEGYDLSKYKPNSYEAIHLIASASRIAFADRDKHIADPDFVKVPQKEMTDEKYLKERAKKWINPKQPTGKIPAGDFKVDFANSPKQSEGPSTTHYSIVDKDGNVVSATTTIQHGWGSGLVVDGIVLNNELSDFTYLPEIEGQKTANRPQAGKKPRSSMSPTIVYNTDGTVDFVIGSPGGARIIGFVLQAIINKIDFGMDIKQAIDAPHYLSMDTYLPIIELEKGFDWKDIPEKMRSVGYNVQIIDLNSGLHAVDILDDGMLAGAADPRRDGIAGGY